MSLATSGRLHECVCVCVHERANKFVTDTAKGDLFFFLFFLTPLNILFQFQKEPQNKFAGTKRGWGPLNYKVELNEKTLHTRVGWAEESIMSSIFWWWRRGWPRRGAATAGKDATVEESNKAGAIAKERPGAVSEGGSLKDFGVEALEKRRVRDSNSPGWEGFFCFNYSLQVVSQWHHWSIPPRSRH